MMEMALLEEVKETENKVRWDADVDGSRFELYIPKWRVPEPWPHRIYVTVSHYDQRQLFTLPPDTARKVPESRNAPIGTHLKKFREYTQTIRYQPVGDASDWEIGEPYIPISMTNGGAEYLTITVRWARN